MTTDVVAAYLGKNDLPADQIPNVINTVFGSLRDLDGEAGAIKSEPPKPAGVGAQVGGARITSSVLKTARS